MPVYLEAECSLRGNWRCDCLREVALYTVFRKNVVLKGRGNSLQHYLLGRDRLYLQERETTRKPSRGARLKGNGQKGG